MAKITSKGEKKVSLTPNQVIQINRYIIDNASYVPYKVKCTAKWQRESSKTLHAIGIGV